MIRYAKERFIEVELLLNEETGLKIPNSAVSAMFKHSIFIELSPKIFNTLPKKYTAYLLQN